MKVSRRILFLLVIFVCVLGGDQLSKEFAREQLGGSPRISLFFDTFRLELAENPGSFLGLGSSLSEELRFWIFVGGTGLILMALLGYVLFAPSLRVVEVFSLLLVCSGGASNLVDRSLRNGLVTDFMNVGIGPLRTGIFNVADMAISAGVLILLLCMLTGKKPNAAAEE